MNSSSVRDRTLIALMLSASLASTIGGLPFNSLPVMLGSLADSFKLDATAVGLMGSVCFAGYLLGTLGAPFWMNRLNWRLLTVISTAGTAASFALSALVKEASLLYVIWALIGFFASTMTCLGMRILADLPNKVRAYGVRQGVELSVTAIALFALPPLVISVFHYPGAALAMAAMVAVLGLSAFWVPHGPVAAEAGAPLTLAHMPAVAWQGLLVYFLFLVGNIGLWAFLERFGVALSVSPGEMGIVFAVLKLLGGVAAFSMAAVGDRAASVRAAVCVLVAIGLGLALLAGAEGFPMFAIGAWVWEFAFTCGCVFQTALAARLDPSGRAVLLVPAVFSAASIAGPALAGYLLAGGGFGWVLGLAAASALIYPLAMVCHGGLRSMRQVGVVSEVRVKT
ncbi:MFS transporter [Comamonas aquatilis]|uniref:MFS transporter n=1 Tax=Comamonas aquatilis TaxID=1778406 RepID=UPI0039F0DE50